MLCVLIFPSADVAGGYSPSILDAIRRALDTSKALTIQDPEHQTLTFEEVFRLATLGGSEGMLLYNLSSNLHIFGSIEAMTLALQI